MIAENLAKALGGHRAGAGWMARCPAHEDRKLNLSISSGTAITQAIFETSKVSDADAIVLRTGEATQALLTALAFVLALSPSMTRSPTAIRKTVDGLCKRLRRRVASVEQSADLKDFVRRNFWNTDEGGNA